MAEPIAPLPMRELRWIIIITLAGLILRIAAASGSLWLDEAWSAVLADDVGTPLGIFVGINHDNNHHLNSLWLQTVGLGAPPLIARALSIVSGSLAILVAGLIGARRGAGVGAVTALLFAVSPVLVTLGSEARGYAPMTLMLLVSAWYIDRYLAGDERADRPLTLAVCFFTGALFQLTMLFAACALIGWPFLVLWRRTGLRPAAIETARLLGPALIALLAALAIVFAPMMLEGVEFRFGSKQPFTVPLFLHGLIDLLGYTVGYTATGFWLPAGAVILVILSRRLKTPRLALYWLAVIAFPLAVAALHTVNAGHPRYYLLVGLALLLLLGEALVALLRAGGGKTVAGAVALGAFSGASMAANLDLIRNRRGDPGPAIQAIAARAPAGADILLGHESDLALLKVAAAENHYPAQFEAGCSDAPFLFFHWDTIKAAPPTVTHCGARYSSIARAETRGLSGQNWTLYQRVG